MVSNSGSPKRPQSKARNKDVAAIKHLDKRSNIPTEELRDFVSEDEQNPKKVLYPRDSALDPQLVWKGKDELDAADLSVPVVPIYIQEKIHPQVLISGLLAKVSEDSQMDLFSDFNGGPKEFDQKIDFYQHEQNWTNRLILGDSLLVMTSLAEKESLRGKVQVIYFDPPYGIKFGSNWQVSTKRKDVSDNKVEDATRQPEQIRAFRDTWQLGIHSYLTYLRDRLVVARDLLTESGSLFLQIGDENVHLVRSLADEVFGIENFVVTLIIKKKGATTPTNPVNDYILWIAKNKESMKLRPLYDLRSKPADESSKYTSLISPSGEAVKSSGLSDSEIDEHLKKGYRWARIDVALSSQDPSARSRPFVLDGREIPCPSNRHWTYDPDVQMHRLRRAGRIHVTKTGGVSAISFWDDFPYTQYNNIWEDLQGQRDPIYVVQTNSTIVERCLNMVTDPGDLVLDPTCGSGTTAFAAEKLGRRWIAIDTSRVALALARTRMMASQFPYYQLADDIEKFGGRVENIDADIRKGFVYKEVPRVSLKMIADCEELVEGISVKDANAIIERISEKQVLFDQPIEEQGRLRVCGPFSVESLSPHRVLSVDDRDLNGSVSESEAQEQQDFVSMILQNLQKSGIQNTHKNERMQFSQVSPMAGRWLTAVGIYKDGEGIERRAAISIGPEHGTVGPEQVKQAAKEAVQGIGFDVLVVCGFAFDPHVSEEAKRYGALTVLPTKMNPDLAMGEDLLKKTGAGNLFMVFGEPDISLDVNKEGVAVELLGVDIYDPTTGQVRSSSIDEIACWFIDTNYNEESFFVRHAYFTGSDKPMEKLQRAMKSEINEEAWSSIYGNISRRFEKPSTNKIAIKVINHYGDEVLKVFEVK
jgi:adenine-specific DNA-methyltransferase